MTKTRITEECFASHSSTTSAEQVLDKLEEWFLYNYTSHWTTNKGQLETDTDINAFVFEDIIEKIKELRQQQEKGVK